MTRNAGQSAQVSRRMFNVLGASGVASLLSHRRAQPVAERNADLDLRLFKTTFSTNFANPNSKIFRTEGGPFGTRYERWSGIRTLVPNKEQELYVDRSFVPSPNGTDAGGHNDAPPGTGTPAGLNPFRLENGCLIITAQPTPHELLQTVGRPYVSGLISTDESFFQRYGYFEMRAQLPAGQGLWPAFWLYGTTEHYQLELDVVEALGNNTTRIYQTVRPNPKRGTMRLTPIDLDFEYSTGVHDYGLLWTPEQIVFYVDRRPKAAIDGAPYRDEVPVYMMTNLAVGGSWGGNPDSATRFPAEMRIEHIRAYQLPGI